MANEASGPKGYDRQDPDNPTYENPDLGPGHDASKKPYDPKGKGNPPDKSSPEDLKQAEEEGDKGLYNPKGDQEGGLASAEAGGGLASGFDNDNENNPDHSYTKRNRARVGWAILRNRKVLVGGGGGIVLSAIVAFFSITSGPLEFVHIAQLMEKFHFSKQEDAQNSRLEKIVRYLHDPSKPERTRMGIVGNAIADKLETKIHDATGLSPDYENGAFKGYVADPKHDNFKGKSPDEMKAIMAANLGVDASSIDTVTNKDGVEVPRYNPSTSRFNSISNYRNQVSTARGLFKEAGFNNISAYMSARVLKTRAGWTFHPIKALDSSYQQQLLKGGKAALDKLKEQFNSDEKTAINTDTAPPPRTNESSTSDNGKGQPVPDPTKGEAATAGSDFQNNPSQSDLKGKIASGSGAALVGVACVLHGINDAVPKLREAKIILPMVKLAGQFVNLGSQVQSGQDITTTQLGLYRQFLHGTDSNGKPSNWNQAQSIQAELGQPQNGPDLPKNAQVFNKGVPFGFIEDIGIIGPVCDALGSPLGTIVSFALAPFSSAFQQFAFGPALDSLVSDYTNWLTGVPLDIFKNAGAGDGNFINYGSRLSANEQFASAGGVQLSSSQELALKDTTNALDNKQFRSKNIAYRVFNPYDEQTLASKVIDTYGAGSAPSGFASLLSSFGSIFASATKDAASLFSGLAHTSAAPAYDYHGLKAVAFSANDLGNSAYDNPFANACAVTGGPNTDGKGCPNPTGILGDPNSPNQAYIDRVQTCFGDTISPNGGNWDINFNSNQQPIDTDSDSYKSADCADSDPSWTRIRFWITDTQTIEGYDCYDGSADTASQSCQDLGFDNSDSSSSSSSTVTGGFTNPFPGGWHPNRLDMGYDGTFSGQIVAPCDGTVTYAGPFTGWNGSSGVIIKCNGDIGFPVHSLYFTEGVAPITSLQGKPVSAGTPIANAAPTPYNSSGNGYGYGANGAIEWGVSQDGPVGQQVNPYAEALGFNGTCSPSPQSKAMVLKFYQWAQQTLRVPGNATDESCAGAN